MDEIKKLIEEINKVVDNIGEKIDNYVSKDDYESLLCDYWKEVEKNKKLEEENTKLKEDMLFYKAIYENLRDNNKELLDKLNKANMLIAKLKLKAMSNVSKRSVEERSDNVVINNNIKIINKN